MKFFVFQRAVAPATVFSRLISAKTTAILTAPSDRWQRILFSNRELRVLGARLVQLREARGLSAAQVAKEALGYDNGSHVAVSRLERAIVAKPRREHLVKLAAFYNVPQAQLLPDKSDATQPATNELSQPAPRAGKPGRQQRISQQSSRSKMTKPPADPTQAAPQAAPTSDYDARESILRFWRDWTPGPAAHLSKPR